MTLDEALSALKAHVAPGRAAQMATYHKVDRPYLGLATPPMNDLAKDWRRALSVDERITLAGDLWKTNIYEARVTAAKLLTQARIRPDDGVWDLIVSWVPDFDSWAIADHASMAGQRRLSAEPSRLDQVETWTKSDHMWTKRAALVMTLPWTKQRNPKLDEIEQRERILAWAAGYVTDKEWFIQKSVAWWLRDLSRRDPHRVCAFLREYGAQMKNFAVKEASKHL